jgi:hypothetical protein
MCSTYIFCGHNGSQNSGAPPTSAVEFAPLILACFVFAAPSAERGHRGLVMYSVLTEVVLFVLIALPASGATGIVLFIVGVGGLGWVSVTTGHVAKLRPDLTA